LIAKLHKQLKITALVAVFLCLFGCASAEPVDFKTGKVVQGPAAYYECKAAGYCK